jgi:hydrogenase maturation protease
VRIVVVGVGNRDRADDGAGLAVAERVRERGPLGVDVVTNAGDPIDLIDAWSDADVAIVVDALVSGARPGRVLRFEADRHPLRAELFPASSHELGVAQAVELARALAVLPPRLVVFGIEGRRFNHGGPVSPEVARAIERVTEAVLEEVRSAGAGWPRAC